MMKIYRSLKSSTRISLKDDSIKFDKIKVRIVDEKYLSKFCKDFNLDISQINTEGYERPRDDLINIDWSGLPEYRVCKDKWIVIELHTVTIEEFTNITNIKISRGSCWYPHRYRTGKEYVMYKDENYNNLQNTYPIYILSLRRYDYNDTYNSLKDMSCKNIKVFVEPSEYDKYKEKIDENDLVKLPEDFHILKEGGKHTRNYIHQYSLIHNKGGLYWLMDDNIDGFYFFQDNIKYECLNGFCFYYLEHFMKKWSNSYIGGMGYSSDVVEIERSKPCIIKNSKVYSCFLINNNISNIIEGELWKGKYNEDIILCIELLQAGYPTFTTNMFLCNKLSTGQRKGGNQVNLYKDKNGHSWDYIKTKYLLDYFPLLTDKGVLKFSNRRGKEYHHFINWKQISINTSPLIK